MTTLPVLAAYAFLLWAPHGRAMDDAGVATPCQLDAAAEQELLNDPMWQCAVRRAQCLLAERREDPPVTENTGTTQHPEEDDNIPNGTDTPECVKEECDISLENVIMDLPGLMPSQQDMEPKLFCRTTSSLVWHWERVRSGGGSSVFVISLRQHGNETWLLHDVVFEPKFIFNDVPIAEEYQLRVQSLTEDGRFAGSCSSKWVTTLKGDFNPLPVTNAVVAEEFQYSENHVNMSIQWKPNKDDMTCDYMVVYWNVLVPGGLLQQKYYPMKFKALLPNLEFDALYRAYVISGDIKHYKWGEKTTVNITTPRCLDVWNNNLNICKPPIPEELNITFLSVGGNQYDMNISWIPATILPEKYIVYMNEMEPPGNRSEQKTADGNRTSVIFKGTKPETLYTGCVYAISAAGKSKKRCDYRKFRVPPTTKKNDEYSHETRMSFIIIVTCLSVLTLVSVFIVTYIYHHKNKKRREKLQRREYFENLEKEPPKENKNYESAAMYFDDEWEIPEDRLLVGDILGEGAFGIVRKGLLQGKSHLDSLQEVAVKMLRDDPNMEDIRQFQQEISMMKSVGKHPHIVSIIGCCTCSKQAQLIVEYCALGDLQNYLRQNVTQLASERDENTQTAHVKYAELMTTNNVEKKSKNSALTPTDLLSFARQISMGMEFLSSNRIVHRDLAARNVLVCSNKTIKISDFGLSRDIYEQNVYHKKGVGKLPIKWMAIESLMYQIYTTQSDVWSFGILLWEIVTLGGMPYPSTPVNRLYRLLKSGYRMECPPNCSPELYEVMLLCWETKPKDRPTFTELHNKLDSLLENSSPKEYLNLNIINVQSSEMSSCTSDQPSRESEEYSDSCTSSLHTPSYSPYLE